MKKITLLFAFVTGALNAQSFPAPYCAISDPAEVSVEEITAVSFSSIAISNANVVDPLVDFTATVAPVTPGQAYSLKVYGNTYGDFDTSIVAFIDWNNNGTLDDSGEIYEVGLLTDSNGSDGVFAEMQITIPVTAASGITRIRITKIYTDEESVSIVDPCAISFDAFGFGTFPGYGQALDFNLAVGSLSSPDFDARSLSVYPVPAKTALTIAYNEAIGSVQVYNQVGQEVYAGHGLGSKVDLDVSNFAAGVYIIRLSNGKQAKTFKIIKE